MKTEKTGKTEKPPVTALRRVGQVGLSFLNPFSDLVVIYRKGVKPTVFKLKLLSQLLTRSAAAGESLSWAQAVERSGRTVNQLKSTFKRIRAAWWCLMAITGPLSLILLLMVLLANVSLPLGTFVWAVISTVLLAELGAVGFVKALAATYRLWQLETQRVSEAEGGTFKDFLAETRWCREVLTLGLARRTDHDAQ